jgi:hypothetical protein
MVRGAITGAPALVEDESMTTTIPQNPQPLSERLDKLEKENRNLVARLERLEKRGGSIFFEVLRTALLLALLAFFLHLMGLLPRSWPLERLPVRAKDVDAEQVKVQRLQADEFLLKDETGVLRAKLTMVKSEPSLTFYDDHGKTVREITPASAHQP